MTKAKKRVSPKTKSTTIDLQCRCGAKLTIRVVYLDDVRVVAKANGWKAYGDGEAQCYRCQRHD